MSTKKTKVIQESGNRISIPQEPKGFAPKTPNHRLLARTIREKAVTFALGPAGSGKTHCACGMASEALDRGEVSRVILTRPAVEAYESLGFLPGGPGEKLAPYLRPLYEEMEKIVGRAQVQEWMKADVLQILPLAFIRGCNLDGFLILDEGQNCLYPQLFTFITRLCPGGRIVITGDMNPAQCDLAPTMRGGLRYCVEPLEGEDHFGVVRLTAEDVCRHEAVKVAQAALGDGPGTMAKKPRPAAPEPARDPVVGDPASMYPKDLPVPRQRLPYEAEIDWVKAAERAKKRSEHRRYFPED